MRSDPAEITEGKIIDGKAFAKQQRQRIGDAVSTLKSVHGLTPGLAVVLVGENPASQVYVRNKAKQTAQAGMRSFEHRLPAETSEDEVLALIKSLNNDSAVHGVLVQLPLPDQINAEKVINTINPDKDVDGFHVINVGRLATGQDALVPCTPVGCVMLAKHALGDLTGLEAVIVGRSNIVGKPMAQLLLQENCTVTMAHSRTRNLDETCRRADILIAAVGRPEMIKGDWIKPGACVIDVGINRVEAPEQGPGKSKLVGDVAYQEALSVAGSITPVPGGVGPMTIACLLSNTVTAACRQQGLPVPDM